MDRCLITVGSFALQFTQFFIGRVLKFDTAESIRHEDSKTERTIHLTPSTNPKLRKDIPTKLLSNSGRDGAAWQESYSYKIVTEGEWFRRLVEQFIVSASEIFIFASSGGGTGNGVIDYLIDTIRFLQPSARIIYIHAINPAVNPIKQMQRIRLIREKGTANELHVIAQSDECIRQALSLQRDMLDAIHEITVNVRTIGGT